MEQNKKPLGEAIPGETLNLLLGSRPIGDEEDTNRVKVAVMRLLHEKYGIVEDDFTLRGAGGCAGGECLRHRSGPQPDRFLRPR